MMLTQCRTHCPAHNWVQCDTRMPNAKHVRTYGLTKIPITLRDQSSTTYRARAYDDLGLIGQPADNCGLCRAEELNPA